MGWKFKKNIIYKNEIIKKDDRKFELLIKDYLDINYPLEHWELTKASRDGNRDIESICSFSGKSMWAEVKYLYKSNKSLSSRRYDSTLVSAELNHTVIQIFFVANTDFGTNIRYRIKEICFLNNIEKIVFIDKDILEYWIKRNPSIENYYFEKPIVLQNESPSIRLVDICILHMRDSYSCDSILDGQRIFALYDYSNYKFEVELFIKGFENQDIEIQCNNYVLFSGKTLSGNITLDFNEIVEKFVLSGKRKITFRFDAKYDKKLVFLDSVTLEFSTQEYIFESQLRCYRAISERIVQKEHLIYNIYGKEFTGKSWVMNKLKWDLLRSKNNKVIYINFCGNLSDIQQVCRIIFLLQFDFFNLNITSRNFERLIDNLNHINAALPKEIIVKLVEALKSNNNDVILSILKGSIFIVSEYLFEHANCYNYNKFFLIDNIHKANKDVLMIFNVILKAFKPLKKITFIITSRECLKSHYTKNIEIKVIENKELLLLINENINECSDEISCLLPSDHKLIYPNIVTEFINDLQEIETLNQVTELYIRHFKERINCFFQTELISADIIEILIYMVCEGVPVQFILKYKQFDWINKKVQAGYLHLDKGYVYPDSKHIINNITSYDVSISQIVILLKELMVFDSDEKNKYIFILIRFCPEFLIEYFDYLIGEVEKAYCDNQYTIIMEIGKIFYKYSAMIQGKMPKVLLVKYLYGFSLLHCGSSQHALDIFYDIHNQYQHLEKDKLYFDNYSEIIDATYWRMIEPKKQFFFINNFRKEWKKYKICGNSRSYLTSTNRFMVQALLQDNFQLANKWFRKNLKLAMLYNSPEHIGYTFMDYAKGIYHLDLHTALNCLNKAEKIFSHVPNEKRRFLDCKCEIAYVRLLLGVGNISDLENASINLFSNGYWKQYLKSKLKLACYHIVMDKSVVVSRKLIIEIQNSLLAQSSVRIQYLLQLLKNYCYKLDCQDINLQLENTSYNLIVNHNKSANKNKAIFYKIGDHLPYYYIDPRAW